MANTIPAAIITAAYDAMNVVSQEMVGLIPAVSKNSKAEQVSVNQDITAPVVGSKTPTDISPGHQYANPTDTEYGTVSVKMTKQRKADFHWTGEEEQKLMNSEGVLTDINRQNIAQCIRGLVNEMEADLAAEYIHASRAYGTAGTPPFGTKEDLTDLSHVLGILDENGAPPMGRSVVLNEFNARRLQGKQPTLFNVNEGGEMRRSFNPISLFGATVRMSHAIKQHDSSNTIAGVAINGAEAVGQTALTVDGGGNNEILNAGDLITIAGDSNKYVAQAMAASATTININAPGLREAAADNAAITSPADYTAMMAFSMDALMLACRVPAVPDGGDLGTRMYLTDPRSGLVFELATFPQYRQRTYEIGIVWGVKTIKAEHLALLIG